MQIFFVCVQERKSIYFKKKVKQSIDDKAMMFEDSLPKMLVMDYCSSCFEQLAPNWKIFIEIMELISWSFCPPEIWHEEPEQWDLNPLIIESSRNDKGNIGLKKCLIPLALGVFYRQLALYRISGVPSFFKGPQELDREAPPLEDGLEL